MPIVFTKCPVTDKPIDTAVEIDEVSFVRLPNFVGRVFCPYCSTEHEWGKDGSWVAERKPGS